MSEEKSKEPPPPPPPPAEPPRFVRLQESFNLPSKVTPSPPITPAKK